MHSVQYTQLCLAGTAEVPLGAVCIDEMLSKEQLPASSKQSEFRARNTKCWLQVYSVQDTQLCLTGTAEVPLGAVYMDQILSEEQLPIKLAGFGHCFRTEAGAGGNQPVNHSTSEPTD